MIQQVTTKSNDSLDRLEDLGLLEVLDHPRASLLYHTQPVRDHKTTKIRQIRTSVDSPCSSNSLERSNFGAFKIFALWT